MTTKDSIEEKVYTCCKTGDFERVKNIYNKKVKIDFNNVLIISCQHNHLDIAKWAYSMGAIPNTMCNYPIREACIRGNLEIAIWLDSIGANFMAVCNYLYLQKCIENKNYHIIKWLYSKNKRLFKNVVNLDFDFEKIGFSTENIDLIKRIELGQQLPTKIDFQIEDAVFYLLEQYDRKKDLKNLRRIVQ